MKISQTKTVIKKDEGSIVETLTSYLPYWPLFLIFLVAAGGGAFFYLRYTIPLYEAAATIIIKDENKGYDESKLMESLDQIKIKKIIENEVEVLLSRTLMIDAIKKLNLYAPIKQEGKVTAISAYNSSPLVVEAYNPDSIKKTIADISLKFDSKNGTILLNNSYKGVINQWLNTPFGTLRFKKNQKYWAAENIVRPFFFSLIPPQKVAYGMINNLKVSPSSKLSSVINLSYRDVLPQLSEDVLNELIFAYGNAAIQEKNNLAKNTLNFIEERLGVIKKDLDTIEGKMQQYKSGRGAVDISRQGELYLENISSNDKRLSDLNIQGAVLDQLERAATSSNGTGLIPSTLGINDPSLTQQLNNLSSLQQQQAKLKTTVAENNPLLSSVNDQITQLKPAILNNIKSQRQSLEQSKNNLYTAGGNYNNILSSIPQKEKQLIEISRDQNIKNGIYSFLLQKREETELSYVSSLSDSKVVNYALSSDKPVKPKKIIVYILALFLGFILPVTLITGKEALSPKILYRKEIETLINIPIVGEIGYNKTKNPVVVAAGKRTVGAEEFRKLRVSLLSLGIDEAHKKILVTSSIPGEGKSFVAANLAISLSLTGKKVILVDLDLHNPGLGKIIGFKEQPGVTNFLNSDVQLEDLIVNIADNENLFYLSSGNLQDDASELLQNGKIQAMISQLNELYDVVIIDSAPVVLITDAYLLSSICNATLYVVRHKFTPKLFVKRIEENQEINPINNPAIVFNGVKTRGFFNNNYGYGYNNYVYGYQKKK